jgi:adenylate cyclase
MFRQNNKLSTTVLPLLAGLAATLLCCLLWFALSGEPPRFFQLMDAKVTDLMFQLRGPIDSSGSVVIVDIDEGSLNQYGQWPWPRDTMAKLVTKIEQKKPKVLGFTMMFAEKDRTSPSYFLNKYSARLAEAGLQNKLHSNRDPLFPDTDALLGGAISKGRVVQGFNFIFREDFLKQTGDRQPQRNVNVVTRFNHSTGSGFTPPGSGGQPQATLFKAYRPLLNIPEVSTGTSAGFLNTISDSDGVTRTSPLLIEMDGEIWPSLALEMYRLRGNSGTVFVEVQDTPVAGSTQHKVTHLYVNNQLFPTDPFGCLGINYYGPFNTFLYIPARDILNDESTFGLENSCVLIGSTAASVSGRVITPFDSQLPNVELQATILDNLIQQKSLHRDKELEQNFTSILIVLAGCLITLTLVYLTPLWALLFCLTWMAAVLTGSWLLFCSERIPFTLSYAFGSSLFIFMVVFCFIYIVEARRRAFIRQAFSQYVSPSVIQELLKNPKGLERAVGNREVTILFCDIRGFSTIAESVSPAELNRTLNAYFNLFTDIIIKHQGTVDKYIGDAIMAVWGSPLEDTHHAEHAVRAALEMEDALNRANPDLFGRTIKVGFGLNSGTVSAGNFGSERRFDYTVFGDNVNLASRVEQLTKEYPETILITDRTRAMLSDGFHCRFVDTVQVRGRIGKVDLYAPLTAGKEVPEKRSRRRIKRNGGTG